MMKRYIFSLFVIVILLSGCISDNGDVDDYDDIAISVGELESFSQYQDIVFDIDPDNQAYAFEPENLYLYDFSSTQLENLTEYGFFISPEYNDVLFHEYYNGLKDANIPIFVTSDSILHSFHILYDYSLRIAEMERFHDDLMVITEAMITRSEEIYSSSSGKLKESAKFNVAFFSVAMKLLDDEYQPPGFVDELVSSELELIGAADTIDVSPLFGYREDYTQYVPRGHYTRNEELGNYFRAMMWYGRMTYRLKVPDQTRSAILLALSTQELYSDEVPVMDLWDDIYLTTSFFVGDADDILIYDYIGVILEVYGDTVSLDDLNDDELLDQFIEKANELPDPRINSSVVTDQEGIDETKGMRFMGQRFIIDSYMFFELVYDNVLNYYGDGEPFTLVFSDAGPIRGFPRGLDVFSVLGFDNAALILEVEGDTDYVGYDSQIEMLREEVAGFTLDEWTRNLYNTWIYTLDSFSSKAEEGWPSFMRSDMWELKELYTALGSWTELRHDTILYAKQSYTFEATAIPPQHSTKGYVEPQPQLYARLLSLTRMAKEGLDDRDLLTPEMESKYEMLDSLLEGLVEISEKEINSEELTEQEHDMIRNMGTYLEDITTFSSSMSYLESEADESVSLIADVHTDLNSRMVLEEAVGYPYSIFVVVKVGDDVLVAQGPVFSYFEFKNQMDNRLTDEEWQEMLKEGTNPDTPEWADEFIIGD